jgi:hypothetical protein
MKNLTQLLKIGIFFLMFFCFTGVYAQNEGNDSLKNSKRVVITKNDLSEYVGIIVSDDGREVLIETENLGKIYINKSDIKSIKKIDLTTKVIDDKVIKLSPFSTRYCFTTNALPIQKGENYTMVNLYGPEVHFALSNNFSLGIMSSWIGSPLVLAAKYSMKTKNENINFSVGTLMGTSGYLSNFRGFGGLHFANVTFGDRAKNLTLAGGYGYFQSGQYTYNGSNYSKLPYIQKGPVVSVAGIVKLGEKASLILDGMLGFFSQDQDYFDYNGQYVTVSGTNALKTTAFFMMPGMRFQTKENKAFQVSLAGVSFSQKRANDPNGYYSNSSSFPLPMCSWFWKF